MKLSENEFLESEIQKGMCYDNPKFRALATNAYLEIKDLPFDTVIDYGAGTGTYSRVLSDHGRNVIAQDISRAHRDYICKNHPRLKVITKPVKADLMLFIEVAEHMTDAEIHKAIEVINPHFILFSSTSALADNDEEWGHINVKSQDDWLIFWEKLGYKLHKTCKYPTRWSKVLQKI